ncbi:MAG: DUF2062 domain-containing protein [Opitutales bacterium]|nr:DUF2062 domain-containing protein [Opitutales bacterium]
MEIETPEQRKSRYSRIHFIKKLLRPLPRRSNIHRYPLLKYFAGTARKRSYIWEFRRRNVIAAIWIGWFVALIPMYGLQMLAAFILCIYLKGNCLIAMALQWVTNPITIPPILFVQYKIGDFLMRTFGLGKLDVDFAEAVSKSGYELLRQISSLDVIFHIAFSLISGGLLISLVGATVMTWVYLFFGKTGVKAKKA